MPAGLAIRRMLAARPYAGQGGALRAGRPGVLRGIGTRVRRRQPQPGRDGSRSAARGRGGDRATLPGWSPSGRPLIGQRRGRLEALVCRAIRELPERSARRRARSRASTCGDRLSPTHVAAYRRQHELGGARVPAVILQRMLAPSASGVAFSADPVSGRRGIAVVAAVRGLGHALVAGDTDADTWRVDREGEIVERQLMTSHARRGVTGPERRPGPRRRGAGASGVAIIRRASGHRMGDRRRPLPVAVTPGDVAARRRPIRMERLRSGTTATSSRATTASRCR